MEVVVRPRQHADLPELAKVLVRVHARDGYPVEGVTDPTGWLTPPQEIAAWTALIADHPIGHISLTQATSADDAATLWQRNTGLSADQLVIPVRLFVDPQHRQRGAGKLLMLAAHNFAKANGYAMAFDVMLKDHEAIRLYEALGCERIGTIDHHHSDGKTEPAAVYVVPNNIGAG